MQFLILERVKYGVTRDLENFAQTVRLKNRAKNSSGMSLVASSTRYIMRWCTKQSIRDLCMEERWQHAISKTTMSQFKEACPYQVEQWENHRQSHLRGMYVTLKGGLEHSKPLKSQQTSARYRWAGNLEVEYMYSSPSLTTYLNSAGLRSMHGTKGFRTARIASRIQMLHERRHYQSKKHILIK